MRIGTSGWMYKDWGRKFYPPDLKKGFLTFLSNEFDTVEVNTSFYHLPLASTFAKWRGETTPSDFVFAVKLSRYITHDLRLQKSYTPLVRFFSRAKNLKRKLGPILIQLPPSLRYDPKLLQAFLRDLSRAKKKTKINARFALEARHASWMEEENAKQVRAVLRAARIAIVFPHSAKIPSFAPEEENITTDFVYVRFHGPSEFAASRYGARRLLPWSTRIKTWLGNGIRVYVYFNNDVHGHAIDDARTLKQLLFIART